MSISPAPLAENAPQCVTNGVTYTFTNQDLSSANACYLYDGANTPSYFNNYDATGAYTGNATTVANVGTIAGAWFQVQGGAVVVPVERGRRAAGVGSARVSLQQI